MKPVVLISMMILSMTMSSSTASNSSKPLDWAKMRTVFRELPNFFIGELKRKILKLTPDDIKLKGTERRERINDLFTDEDISDIKRNLMLWADYAKAELGNGGTPAIKKLMQRLTKIYDNSDD